MKWRAVAAAALISVGLSIGPAVTAEAAAPTVFSAEAPTPSMPDRGLAGLLIPPPPNPPTGDPETNKNLTWFEVYGAGGAWSYDSGLVTGAKDGMRSMDVWLANFIAQAPQAATYTLFAFASVTYQPQAWLSSLDPAWNTTGAVLRDGISEPFAPLIAVIVLLFLAVGIIKARLSVIAGMVAVTFLAVGLAWVGGNNPAKAGAVADNVLVTTQTSIRNGLSGTTSGNGGIATFGRLSDRITYDGWVTGALGDSTSPTAVKYGPCLYKASNYSWAEAAEVRRDPDAAERINDEKADNWDRCAGEVEDTDKVAYGFLSGQSGASGATKVGTAIYMFFAWIAVFPMILVSLFLTAMAFLLFRLIVTFFPVLAWLVVVQAAWSARNGNMNPTILKSIAATFGAALINSTIFGAAASVLAILNLAVLSSALPTAVSFVICAVLTFLFWTTLAPFRKLTRMVHGVDPFKPMRDMGETIGNTIKGVLTAATGSVIGNVAANSINGKTDTGDIPQQQGQAQPERAPRYVRPAYAPTGHRIETEVHPYHQRPDTPVVGGGTEAQSLPAGHGHTLAHPHTEVTVVHRRAAISSHPEPVHVDGATVHHPTSNVGAGLSPADQATDGTYLIYDPDHGLIEVTDGSDEEVSA